MKPEWLLVPCMGLLSALSGAATLQELMQEDQLRLRSWLQPAQEIVVGEEVKLIVEVSTRRWFAGGTRIQHPEIAHLVVLQRDRFATNLSRQEQGRTWVVQQWALELYPQQAAAFRIPSLRLELAVNDARAGVVRGSLQTEALEFVAGVPAQLAGVEAWLATPQFRLSREFDRDLTGLQPGDAFTRTIRSSASQVTSMMLPTPLVGSAAGLAVYPDNPVLQDKSNRGEAIAERTDRVTYVVEQSGQYRLPEQTFYWWDSSADKLRVNRLAAVTIDAGTPAGDRPAAAPEFIDFNVELRWIFLAAAVIALAILLRLRSRRAVSVPARQILTAANRALKKGDARLAATLLYSWLNTDRAKPDWHSLRETARNSPQLARNIEQLLQSAYGRENANKGTLPAANLRALADIGKKRRRRLLPAVVDLSLNPDNSSAQQKASARQ